MQITLRIVCSDQHTESSGGSFRKVCGGLPCYDARMNAEIVKRTLAWSAIINYAILIIWFVAFFAAHDWLFGLHARFGFRLSAEQFDFAHYMGMAIYKLGIMLLNLVPYLALRIATRN